MKIETLLELIEPDVKQFQYDKKFKDRETTPNVLGYGNFSKVRATSDPHIVKKSSLLTTTGHPQKDDAYWDFVDLILKNKLWENPYFPRIYRKTSLKGRDQSSHHSVQMEKLESLKDFGAEEMVPIVRRSFTKKGREWVGIKAKTYSYSQIPNTVAEILEYSVKTGNLSFIKDDELSKALKILNLYAKHNNIEVDIHSENIMGRRTPFGLQLVITDPFSFKSGHSF